MTTEQMIRELEMAMFANYKGTEAVKEAVDIIERYGWNDPEIRLPPDDEFVLALVTGTVCGVQCEHSPVIASYCADDPKDGGWMLVLGQDQPDDNWKVDAWMPVPEWEKNDE